MNNRSHVSVLLLILATASANAQQPSNAPAAAFGRTSTAPSVQQRNGFTIDWQGAPQTPEVAASLETQIRMVEQAPVSPEVMAYFRAQRITVDRPGEGPPNGGPARASPRGVFFARMSNPPDNPVLLHELIHRWHFMEMRGGIQNADVKRLYEQARASGQWPAGSYMLKNPAEFLAMTASVVIHGRAARPPFTREAVRLKAPETYAFIVREFGYHGPGQAAVVRDGGPP